MNRKGVGELIVGIASLSVLFLIFVLFFFLFDLTNKEVDGEINVQKNLANSDYSARVLFNLLAFTVKYDDSSIPLQDLIIISLFKNDYALLGEYLNSYLNPGMHYWKLEILDQNNKLITSFERSDSLQNNGQLIPFEMAIPNYYERENFVLNFAYDFEKGVYS